MIKLENVSSIELITSGYSSIQNLSDAIENNPNLKKYGVIARKPMIEIVNEAKMEVAKANIKKIEPTIYQIPQNVSFSDYFTNGDVIITNPAIYSSTEFRSLKDYSIYDIKQMLTHTDTKGNNLLTKLRGIGPEKVEKLLPLLQFYDEQVKRLADGNDYVIATQRLFNRNKEEKQEIVESDLNEIVTYLLDETKEELIWGKLTDNQKLILLSATRNLNRTRENLIKIFTDYTTLPELEQGITKTKSLNRFIVK